MSPDDHKLFSPVYGVLAQGTHISPVTPHAPEVIESNDETFVSGDWCNTTDNVITVQPVLLSILSPPPSFGVRAQVPQGTSHDSSQRPEYRDVTTGARRKGPGRPPRGPLQQKQTHSSRRRNKSNGQFVRGEPSPTVSPPSDTIRSTSSPRARSATTRSPPSDGRSTHEVAPPKPANAQGEPTHVPSAPANSRNLLREIIRPLVKAAVRQPNQTGSSAVNNARPGLHVHGPGEPVNVPATPVNLLNERPFVPQPAAPANLLNERPFVYQSRPDTRHGPVNLRQPIPLLNTQDGSNPWRVITGSLAAQLLLLEVQLVYWAIETLVRNTPDGVVGFLFGHMARIADECAATLTALSRYYEVSREFAPVNTIRLFHHYFKRLTDTLPWHRPFDYDPLGVASGMSLIDANRVLFDAPGSLRYYARLSGGSALSNLSSLLR